MKKESKKRIDEFKNYTIEENKMRKVKGGDDYIIDEEILCV